MINLGVFLVERVVGQPKAELCVGFHHVEAKQFTQGEGLKLGGCEIWRTSF